MVLRAGKLKVVCPQIFPASLVLGLGNSKTLLIALYLIAQAVYRDGQGCFHLDCIGCID